MSLDVYLHASETHACSKCGHEDVVSSGELILSQNITHNLGRMADEAGIYQHLWRPDEIGVTRASQLVEPLRAGVALMKSDPDRFQKFNAENGWGLYKHFLPFCERYLMACEENPSHRERFSMRIKIDTSAIRTRVIDGTAMLALQTRDDILVLCDEVDRLRKQVAAYSNSNCERPIGCLCTWEQGDSPCPVHGEED